MNRKYEKKDKVKRDDEEKLNPKEILKSIIELRESINELREAQKKTDEQLRKTDEQINRMSARIENLGREIGKLRDSQSEFMEGIVLPSAQKFIESLGMKITGTLQNYEIKDEKGQTIAEYDAIFFSGDKVFVVEVKSSAGSRDVDRFIENIRKIEKSNIKFSEVYGILASARFKNWLKSGTIHKKNRKTKNRNKQFIGGTEKYALRRGLAVLMPSGEILAPQKKNFRPIIKKK